MNRGYEKRSHNKDWWHISVICDKPTAHTNLGSFSKDACRPSFPLDFASKVMPGSSSSQLGMGPTVASIVGDDLPS